jgi:hypothetical protein
MLSPATVLMTTAPYSSVSSEASARVSHAKVFIWAHGLVVSASSVARLAAVPLPHPSGRLRPASVFLDTAAPDCIARFLKQALPVTGTLPCAVDEPLGTPALTTQEAKIGLSSPFLKALVVVANWTASSPPSCTYSFGTRVDRSGDYRNKSWFQNNSPNGPAAFVVTEAHGAAPSIKPLALTMANL